MTADAVKEKATETRRHPVSCWTVEVNRLPGPESPQVGWRKVVVRDEQDTESKMHFANNLSDYLELNVNRFIIKKSLDTVFIPPQAEESCVEVVEELTR